MAEKRDSRYLLVNVIMKRSRELYAGAKLRETRQRLGLTQKDFAAKLGVSLPYLNQMENNNRPVSTTVVLALAQEFGVRGIPTLVILDGNGKLITKDGRADVHSKGPKALAMW